MQDDRDAKSIMGKELGKGLDAVVHIGNRDFFGRCMVCGEGQQACADALSAVIGMNGDLPDAEEVLS